MNRKLLSCSSILILSLLFMANAGCFAADRSITLQWDESIDAPYLQSYRIYYYTVSGDINSLNTADYADSYTLSGGGSIAIGASDPKLITIDKSNTSITIHVPDETKTYYFVVSAVDTNGLESVPTVELCSAGTAPPPPAENNSGGGGSGGGGGGGCFIATAAFGSYLDPHVYVLRVFRDQVLLKHHLGQLFVKNYYTYSPPIADFIHRHESLRALTRWALTPLIYGVQYPLASLGIIMVLLIATVLRTLLYGKKKRISTPSLAAQV